MKKTLLSISKTHEDMLKSIIQVDINQERTHISNPERVLFILNYLPSFRDFLTLNNLTQKSMLEALSEGTYVTVKEDDYVFYQDSASDCYYLILSGTISFRVRNFLNIKRTNTKKISNQKIFLKDNNADDSATEIERGVCHEGQFFGEWGLIFDIPRTTSAVSVNSDSVLLSFNKKTFDKYFSRPLIKSENDIKVFLFEKIKSFGSLSKKLFNQYYREIKKLFPKRDECIFEENEIADRIYLIYKGKCYIKQKKCKNPILIKDKGDFAGLVSFTDNNKYEYSLYSSANDTVVFKLRVNDYVSTFYSALKKELLPYHYAQVNIMERCKENKKLCEIKSIKEKEARSMLTIQPDLPYDRPNGLRSLFELRIRTHNLLQSSRKENRAVQFLSIQNKHVKEMSMFPFKLNSIQKSDGNTPRHKYCNKSLEKKSSIGTEFFSSRSKTEWSPKKKKILIKKALLSENNTKKKVKIKIKHFSNIFDAGVEKSIQSWNETKTSKHFSTGGYVLPLYTLTSV